MKMKSFPLLLSCVLALNAAHCQESRPKGSGKGADSMLDSLGVPKAAAPAQTARDWWGVRTQTLPLRLEGEEPVPAAEVVEIHPSSAAARAGLRQGDLIVGVQMRQLTGAADLERAVAAVAPGGKLSLQLVRDGNPMEIIVTRGGASVVRGATPSPQPAIPPASAAPGRTAIYINGREITAAQVEQLRSTYGYLVPPGQYWYDPTSGLYGVMGREAAGFMQPGHNFGPLPANASNGNTGVFINGRQINMVEAMYCQRLFGAVYQGRWWLDGRTGNLGAEGSPVPIANVYMALQQSQRSSQGGGYSWHSKITGASGGSDGKCSYVSIPGSGSVMSGNCD
jgi:membrane-associated protease RseP (regulator of RpoE activity)